MSHLPAQSVLVVSTTTKKRSKHAHNVLEDNTKTPQVWKLAKIAQSVSTCSLQVVKAVPHVTIVWLVFLMTFLDSQVAKSVYLGNIKTQI